MYDFCVLQIAEIPGITKKNAMPAMALVANLHQSIAMVTVWLCVWDYNFFFSYCGFAFKHKHSGKDWFLCVWFILKMRKIESENAKKWYCIVNSVFLMYRVQMSHVHVQNSGKKNEKRGGKNWTINLELKYLNTTVLNLHCVS